MQRGQLFLTQPSTEANNEPLFFQLQTQYPSQCSSKNRGSASSNILTHIVTSWISEGSSVHYWLRWSSLVWLARIHNSNGCGQLPESSTPLVIWTNYQIIQSWLKLIIIMLWSQYSQFFFQYQEPDVNLEGKTVISDTNSTFTLSGYLWQLWNMKNQTIFFLKQTTKCCLRKIQNQHFEEKSLSSFQFLQGDCRSIFHLSLQFTCAFKVP